MFIHAGFRACALVCMLGATVLAQTDESSFVPSIICADCHSRLYPPGVEPNFDGLPAVDPESVAPYALWSGSMMAHSSVDPYWQAKVRFEAAEHPVAAAAIENTCLRCHAPGQQYDEGRDATPLRLNELNDLGREGVTCTVCHQIDPANLGSRESFTAGFVINDRQEIYGPHRNPFPMPMLMHTGRTPTYSPHMLESELCGSCHTVITPVLNESGQATGEFLEQGTYLEWLTSSHAAAGRTCQTCHMPQLRDQDGMPASQYIAHTPHGGYFGPTAPRSPFGQHSFLGANVQMLMLLAEQLPSEATALTKAADGARENLSRGVGLAVAAQQAGRDLAIAVTVKNRTGHKLPSGFPSRRLWLHLMVTNADGETVFESGGFDPETGELLAQDSERIEPHHATITAADQTAIYEAVTANPSGAHTLSLLTASGFLKDNRLLPPGFDESRLQIEGMERFSLAPIGVEDDPDFVPGSDTVRYVFPAVGPGPWRVEVEALYQSIKPGDTVVFDAMRSAEEDAFLRRFARHRGPVQAAVAEATIPVRIAPSRSRQQR